MGNCNASIGDVDKLRQVQRGILDKTCFTEHRALGQGGFGTVLAVTKNFGTKADRDEFHAMKRLDKDRICTCDGMDVLVMGELHFMEEISEVRNKVQRDKERSWRGTRVLGNVYTANSRPHSPPLPSHAAGQKQGVRFPHETRVRISGQLSLVPCAEHDGGGRCAIRAELF